MAAVLAMVVLVAVVACAAGTGSMAHRGIAPCMGSAHGNSGTPLASGTLVMPAAMPSGSPNPVVATFASHAPVPTDVASLGAPPDDPLHGLLLL